jgi:hypothetical protein
MMHGTGLRDYGVHRHFQQYFSYIVVVSYISGGNALSGKNHRLIGLEMLRRMLFLC